MNALIRDLEKGVKDKLPYISFIKKPEMLISSLKGLNDMIGNDRIKDKVALQVTHLLTQKLEPESSQKPIMLHTLIYGDPGLGKTTIGVHLAKIWYALGYIDGGKSSGNKCQDAWLSDKLGGFMGEEGANISNEEFLPIVYAVLLIVFMVFGYVWAGIKWCYGTMGAKWFFIMLGVIFFLLLIVWMVYAYSSSDSGPKYIDGQCNNNNNPKCKQQNTKQSSEEITNDDIITITSREDFIAEYVGWTDKKTKKLLRENRGKVLFIDEAYTLNSGYHDSFGKEAIDTLNRYMSENADKIVIIMAGYKDKIQNSLFKVQPGLKRRFMWQFECKGYTIDELFKIWIQQIHPWIIANEQEALEVFRMYKWAFPNYAGDTLRLTNYVQIEHSRDIIAGINPTKNVLSTKHILKGIQTLTENNMDVNTNNGIDDSKIQEILETFESLRSSKSKTEKDTTKKEEMSIVEID